MKSFIGLTLLAPAFLVAAQDDCPEDCVGAPALFTPAPISSDLIDPVVAVEPSLNLTIPYASNSSTSVIEMKNTMKLPTVLLETIASVISVDCSATSVQLTFNDSAIFETTYAAWTAQDEFLLVTNHFGDCDEELERGFFLVDGVEFDNTTLVCTAQASKTNLSSTAEFTEITFGQIPATELAARNIVIDPSYTLNTDIALAANTVLYQYDPYVTITADKATFDANVTFSGYLSYNWLTFSLKSLYFDIDAAMSAGVGISADVTASYATTFSYSPSTLFYGITVPGILELGPQLKFAVTGDVSASAAVNVSTEFGIDLADGNVHIDFLNSALTTTSGWVPTYEVSADISGQAIAKLNPSAELTVELAINFFGGLLDLSSGVTVQPGFVNTFELSGGAGVDLTGLTGLNSNGTCSQGLMLDSEFTFAIDVFATQFYTVEVYNVTVPIVDQCFAWA